MGGTEELHAPMACSYTFAWRLQVDFCKPDLPYLA
jgi:hypothetical protein